MRKRATTATVATASYTNRIGTIFYDMYQRQIFLALAGLLKADAIRASVH